MRTESVPGWSRCALFVRRRVGRILAITSKVVGGLLSTKRTKRLRSETMCRPRLSHCSLLLVATVFASECVRPGLWTDGTSVSFGKTHHGFVRRPHRIPNHGPGYVTPERWRERGFRFGTDELVAAIERAAAAVNRQHGSSSKLGVADLSHRSGGRSRWHSSHHSGRDVDLLFYTTNVHGRAMSPPNNMIQFDGDGSLMALDPKGPPIKDWAERRFDTPRNWALVEALLSDPSIRVQWIFVSDPLRERLLRFAEAKGRPAWLQAFAAEVMFQPSSSAPHDDHFHVRIFCARSDRAQGCIDRQPIWHHEKKHWNYNGPERYDPVLWRFLLRPPRPLM